MHLGNAFAQAAIVTINQKRPGIATWAILAAWVQIVATILVLIGSCVWAGGSLDSWAAGVRTPESTPRICLPYALAALTASSQHTTLSLQAILLLIGFTLWGHALLAAFSISYVVSTVVPLMPDYKQVGAMYSRRGG